MLTQMLYSDRNRGSIYTGKKTGNAIRFSSVARALKRWNWSSTLPTKKRNASVLPNYFTGRRIAAVTSRSLAVPVLKEAFCTRAEIPRCVDSALILIAGLSITSRLVLVSFETSIVVFCRQQQLQQQQ